MQILIPIAGRTNFFPEDEYFFPKPLIEIFDRPMIQVVVDNFRKTISDPEFIFVVDQLESQKFSIVNMLKLTGGSKTKVVEREPNTAGALCSCLLAIDEIDRKKPLIIANSDMVVDVDLSETIASFKKAKAEVGLIVFNSIHPRWSYIRPGIGSKVLQTDEKEVISNQAIAGFYYFDQADLFFTSAKKVIINHITYDNSYYISSTVNECILSGKNAEFIEVDHETVHSFHSPSSVAEYIRKNLNNSLDTKVVCERFNVIIPSAGLGRRFAQMGWKKPKPFIDINNRMMIELVVDNLAHKNADYHIILQKEHIKDNQTTCMRLKNNHTNIIPIEGMTEGTVCTVLHAFDEINSDKPLVIANSDQIVDFNFDEFVTDAIARNLDGSILVFEDSKKNPKWSFAKINETGNVIEVAEKNPISNLATVGIYFFASGKSFIKAAIQMIVSNERVNNEFYTCPIYNYLIKNGAEVGIYKVDEAHMYGLGTPEDLTEFMRKNNFPISKDMPSK